MMRVMRALRRLYLASRREQVPFSRMLSYEIIARLNLQERFSATYCGARFHPFRSNLSKAIWLRREQFQRKDMQFLLDLLRPADCLLDIGANVGTHSICPSRKLGGNLRVYAFEPHPVLYEYLVKNMRLNRLQNIVPINAALGNEEGTITLVVERADDTSWVSRDSSITGIEVPLRRLDSYDLELSGHTVVMKMDVEGYELYALQGSEATLDKVHFACLEMGDRHSLRVGYSAQDLMRYLEGRGFQLFRFETPRRLVQITSAYQPPDVESLVAVKDAGQLRARLPEYEIVAFAESPSLDSYE